ncbi:putative ribonuclease H-like domain-containing protein [Tanacetum coccineum]
MTLKEVDGKTVEEIETKIIAKDGTVTRVPGKFQGYETSEEEPPEGNMNGWLMEDEEELERNEVDSDLESTASSKPKHVELEDICESGSRPNPNSAEDVPDYMFLDYSMAPNRRGGAGGSGNEDEEQPNVAEIIAQQLQNIIPQIVNQVTTNMNNANNGNGNGGGGNGNGNNNGCTFKTFQSCNPKEYDGKGGAIVLTRWIKKMENMIDNSGCAENQKAAMAMTWNDFKALLVEEFCPCNEMEKLENKFWNHKMVGANHAAYTDRFHELAKLVPHLVTPESSRIKRYITGLAPEIRGMLRATQPATIQNAILRAGILTDEAVSCGTLTKGNDKRKVVEEPSKSGGSWKDNKKAKVGTRNELPRSFLKMSVPITAEEKTNKKNDVKARSLLLMALPNEHQLTFSQYSDAKTMFAAIKTRFGGNEATKKTQKTLLKQQYENFSASSTESLDSIFNRLQKIVSRLAILVWMNKADIETMSIDDLYNNFKIVEQDVKKSVGASSGAQNLAFLTTPSTSSTNDVNTANPAYEVSTVSPNINTACPQVSTANFSDNTVYAFMVENPNGSNLLQQDLEKIHEDDLEAMDLKWQLSLLSMRAKRYFQRTRKKIFINANDTAGYDKSKVECFNYHKMGHFARECRAPRNKEGQFKYQDNTRKQGNNEDTSSKAMLAIDGVGFD